MTNGQAPSPNGQTGAMLTIINTVLAGVAAAYVTTGSVAVTCLASGVAVLVVLIMAGSRRTNGNGSDIEKF
jgi:hypothetical protein